MMKMKNVSRCYFIYFNFYFKIKNVKEEEQKFDIKFHIRGFSDVEFLLITITHLFSIVLHIFQSIKTIFS